MSSRQNLDLLSPKMALWTCRLFQSDIADAIKSDEILFAAIYSALHPFLPNSIPVNSNAPTAMTKESREQLNELNKRLWENGIPTEGSTKYLNLMCQGINYFEKCYYTGDWKTWDTFINNVAKKATKMQATQISSVETNAQEITKLLKLSDLEKEVLIFQILRNQYVYNTVFTRIFALAKSAAAFSSMMDNIFDSPSAMDAVSPNSQLIKSGLITLNVSKTNIQPMSPVLVQLFATSNTPKKMFAEIVKPTEAKHSVSGSIGTIGEQDAVVITDLLGSAVRTQTMGVNVMLYGSAKLDKKAAVHRMMSDKGFDTVTLITKDTPRNELYTRAYLAQRYLMATSTTPTVLVIEQAEDVLGRTPSAVSFFFMSHDDDDDEKEDLGDALLHDNPIPSIWLVDRPKSVSEDNVARFLFHAEVKTASRDVRRQQIMEIIKDLSPDLQSHLSKYMHLSYNQVKSARRLSDLIDTNNDTKAQERTVIQAIKQSQTALARDEMEELRESVTKYSLEFINVKNKFTPEHIISAFKKNPRGTLCLYGIPGSGKTQFAEYIALQCDKPIIKKRASDLLSKWVGENEQNIAAMFQEARRENAILFLDEADSFLRDRALAQAEWNVTKVNELLQQMERHEGIFVCATNLFRDIDAAALRRFTFKLEFLEMTDDQRWKMFQNEAPITGMTEEQQTTIRKNLLEIRHLTPGDFATVKRQSLIFGEVMTPEEWIQQLKLEARDKLVGLNRNSIGFTGKVE